MSDLPEVWKYWPLKDGFLSWLLSWLTVINFDVP